MTTGPALTATLWGGAGMLAGAATGFLLALPFYPRDTTGFEGLGWFLAAAALAAILALVAGSLAIHRGLRRFGAHDAGRTALAFVPVAVLLAVVTGGIGALAAPALAPWVAGGFARRQGWGPQRIGGLPQRLLVTAVACFGLAAGGLGYLGYDLGGRVNGTFLTWLAVLPAVVVPSVVLLRRVLPWRVLAGGIAVLAAVLALAAPLATADAKPQLDRLEQIATDLPVPPGQSVHEVQTARMRSDLWTIPVVLLSTGGPVPATWGPLPASPAGVTAAADWNAVLRAEGWTTSGSAGAHWVPEGLLAATAGHPLHSAGPWTRASAVPYGDGALLVLSTRP